MPDLTVRYLSYWRPMSSWELSDMTGIPEEEIRRQYGDTVTVRYDLRGIQEIRPSGPRTALAEVEASTHA